MTATLVKGHLTPTKAQLANAKCTADDSFTRCWDHELFRDQIPFIPGWEADVTSGVLLRLKNVDPHNDDWCGSGKRPKKHRSVFWLLSTSARCVYFGAGAKHVEMRPGDYVFFNHQVNHWVMSSHVWRGAAWQLRG